MGLWDPYMGLWDPQKDPQKGPFWTPLLDPLLSPWRPKRALSHTNPRIGPWRPLQGVSQIGPQKGSKLGQKGPFDPQKGPLNRPASLGPQDRLGGIVPCLP